MKFTFNVLDKIKEAWFLYKANFKPMLALTAIMFALQMISKGKQNEGKSTLLVFISILVGFIVSYIWTRANLDLLSGNSFEPFSQKSWSGRINFWRYLKTNILVSLCIIPLFVIPLFLVVAISAALIAAGAFFVSTIIMIIIAFILLIIPAIYISIRLFPAKYISIDKNQGARLSVKEAWFITRGYGWKILGSSLLIGLFTLAGFVALFVGLLITFPISLLVLTMLYRDLAKFKVTQGTLPQTIKEIEASATELKF